jgi:hypothetical protein
MPPNTVKVDRSTRYGNPYVARGACGCSSLGECRRHLIHVDTPAAAVEAFRAIARSSDQLMLIREHLHGKNLACWCPLDQPCHADVLLEIANGEALTAHYMLEPSDEALLADHEMRGGLQP